MSDLAIPTLHETDSPSPFSGEMEALSSMLKKGYNDRIIPTRNNLKNAGATGAAALYLGEKLDEFLSSIGGEKGSGGGGSSPKPKTQPKSSDDSSDPSGPQKRDTIAGRAMGMFGDKMKSTKMFQMFSKGKDFLSGLGIAGEGRKERLENNAKLGEALPQQEESGGLFESKREKKAMVGKLTPKRAALLNYGALGAGFVYLAESLGGATEGVEAPERGGMLRNITSRLGLGRGGGRGMMAGAKGALAKMGPMLAAAGPWVAIAATIAGTAVAFKNEWDKQAESMGEEIRDVWGDENATFMQKMGVTLKNVGKGIFGALAGGVRGVTDGVKERVGKIRGIWQDEERGLLSKIGGTVGNAVAGLAETGWNFLKGFGKTIGDGVIGLFPDEKQEQIRESLSNAKEKIKGFFSGVGGFFKNFGSNISGFASRIGGGVKNFFTEGIPNFFSRVRERAVERGAQAKKIFESAKEKIGGIFQRVGGGIRNFFGRVTDLTQRESRSSELSGGPIRTFFSGIGERVTGFFDDVKEEGLGSAIANQVSETVENVKNFFGNLGQGIRDFMGSVQEEGLGRSVGRLFRSEEQVAALESIEEMLGGKEAYDQYLKDAGYTNMFGGANEGAFLNSSDFSEMATRAGVDPNKVVHVDDAIIRPNGQIIKTHPDDTLIAAQLGRQPSSSDRSAIAQMDRQSALTDTERAAMMGSVFGPEIVAAINRLIAIMENKNMGTNVVQQNVQAAASSSSMRRSALE